MRLMLMLMVRRLATGRRGRVRRCVREAERGEGVTAEKRSAMAERRHGAERVVQGTVRQRD